MDFALVHCGGRAVADAQFYEGDSLKAVFDLAINMNVTKGGNFTTKPIFRRVVAWNSFAKYIKQCQESDPEGLRGRMIFISGTMDTETYQDKRTEAIISRDVIRVGRPQGVINIIDRRLKDER